MAAAETLAMGRAVAAMLAAADVAAVEAAGLTRADETAVVVEAVELDEQLGREEEVKDGVLQVEILQAPDRGTSVSRSVNRNQSDARRVINKMTVLE